MLTDIQKLQIENMRKNGESYNTIANELGITYKQVRGYLDRNKNNGFCLQCNRPLTQSEHRKEKKFCSDKCRMAWWNDHKELIQRKPHHTQECEYCHKTYNCYRTRASKYCSRECYAKARRKG